MKILFTGASSFTGMWFARELARAGHEVTATFRRRPDEYPEALRRTRAVLALEHCRGEFDCAFGDERFLALARSQRWDLLCHHGADVTNYRSPDFNAAAALSNNTRNLPGVLDALVAHGAPLPAIALTGSVFEPDEGAGSEGLPAFSPYGLSKGFTWQAFRYHALRAGFTLGKFVIPNPFGPYEEPRFTAYLMKTWAAGQVAEVKGPAYVRDNIHVSLLAKAYVRFVEGLPGKGGVVRLNPSGYVESQGAFALRFAAEMRKRTGMACEVALAKQVEFAEPRVRVNTEPADADAGDWAEDQAWDAIAAYHVRAAGMGLPA